MTLHVSSESITCCYDSAGHGFIGVYGKGRNTMTELLTQQMQQLLELLKEQNERIRLLESRVDSLEMSDPPAIKSLYETLTGNDSTDNLDSSIEDDMFDGIASFESYDSTLAPVYSPPLAMVSLTGESPTGILPVADVNATTIQRYTRDEIIDIGRRWTLMAGMPAKHRKVERIPLSQPLPLNNILRDSNNATSPTVSTLRITIDNGSVDNASNTISNMPSVTLKGSSDIPRKSFRQILEMYSCNNSGHDDMLQSTQTAQNESSTNNKNRYQVYQVKSKNNNKEDSCHIFKSDSNDSFKSNHMKKDAHRAVKLQNHHHHNTNNNTNKIAGHYQGSQQLRQKSLGQSNRCHGNNTNKFDGKKDIKSQEARIACTFDPLTMFAPPVGPSRSEEELIRESSRLGDLVVHAPGNNNQSAFIDA